MKSFSRKIYFDNGISTLFKQNCSTFHPDVPDTCDLDWSIQLCQTFITATAGSKVLQPIRGDSCGKTSSISGGTQRHRLQPDQQLFEGDLFCFVVIMDVEFRWLLQENVVVLKHSAEEGRSTFFRPLLHILQDKCLEKKIKKNIEMKLLLYFNQFHPKEEQVLWAQKSVSANQSVWIANVFNLPTVLSSYS